MPARARLLAVRLKDEASPREQMFQKAARTQVRPAASIVAGGLREGTERGEGGGPSASVAGPALGCWQTTRHALRLRIDVELLPTRSALGKFFGEFSFMTFCADL